jgi:hypothetical protein
MGAGLGVPTGYSGAGVGATLVEQGVLGKTGFEEGSGVPGCGVNAGASLGLND